MLKGLKDKKAGKGDIKKEAEKKVSMPRCRNNPRNKSRRRKTNNKKKTPTMPWSKSISNFCVRQ